jgi:hypothetical protein
MHTPSSVYVDTIETTVVATPLRYRTGPACRVVDHSANSCIG